MSVCKSSDVPNVDKAGELPRDMRRIYIEHTKGAWLRHNEEDQTIEMWHDGQFLASWSDLTIGVQENPNREDVYINSYTVVAMLNDILEHGKRLRSKEVRELLGAK